MIDLFIFILIMIFLSFVPMYAALILGATAPTVYAAALSGAVVGAVLLFARNRIIAFLSGRKEAIATFIIILYTVVLFIATISELLDLGWFRFLSF